jgi:hypothetical protein
MSPRKIEQQPSPVAVPNPEGSQIVYGGRACETAGGCPILDLGTLKGVPESRRGWRMHEGRD